MFRSVKRSAQRDRRGVAELYYLELRAPAVGNCLVEIVAGIAPGVPLVATVACAENLEGSAACRTGKGNSVTFPGATLDDGTTVSEDTVGFGSVCQGRSCSKDGSSSDESCFDHR